MEALCLQASLLMGQRLKRRRSVKPEVEEKKRNIRLTARLMSLQRYKRGSGADVYIEAARDG